MKKDYQWAIWLFIIIIAVLASSCGDAQTKYKGHVIGNSITRIVYDEPGYNKGDTIQIQLGYNYPKFVIDTILSR